MKEGEGANQLASELVPQNVIRVETGLSRYPVHRLAKQGTISIEIREKSSDGEMLVQWEVSHSSRYGQPGPLAYKIDSLIVNRRIEEASRPIPKIIRLGSQAGIAEELGISTHDTVSTIKRALFQNASAFITAKLRYKLADGSLKELEAGFNRYSVVFTGEELPDGRKADAVYLVLNEVFMQVINGAQTRPLDYDYLKNLPPASQRLYELLSFQIYAALRNGRKQAKLSYSDFCTYAPLTRVQKWDQVRPQMARIHRPHLKSGYIESVEFEQTTGRDGKPDWLMIYIPGPKAKAEFRAFTKRGGPRTLEIEQTSPPLGAVAHQVVLSPLEIELVDRGVSSSAASQLVAEFSEEDIRAEFELFDWLKEKKPTKVKDDGAYLTSAIRGRFSEKLPQGFESKSDRENREAAKKAEQRRASEATRKAREMRAAENSAKAKVDEYLARREAEDGGPEQFNAEALAHADPVMLATYEQMTPASIRKSYLRVIREKHARRLLGIHEASEAK